MSGVVAPERRAGSEAARTNARPEGPLGGVIDVSARVPRKLTLSQRLYFPEILGGMAVTIRHLVRNLVNIRNLPTILYPEKKRDYSNRFRGKHVLKAREDGTLKCVACYMCAQACPAECITIVAGEHPKISYEKYPVVFDIDMLRCVYCGFCVDACPKDAIWMTRNYEMAFFTRAEAIFGIDKLRETPGELPKDGWGYRPYYQGDGTVPPADASERPVVPGDGNRSELRIAGLLPTYRPPAIVSASASGEAAQAASDSASASTSTHAL